MALNSLPGLDFGLGSDIDMLRDTVHAFAQNKIAPYADEIDRSNSFPRELWPQLGEFVLRRSLSDGTRWRNLTVAVNLSPIQIRDPKLVALVGAVIAESGIAPSRVILEITEGVLIVDP